MAKMAITHSCGHTTEVNLTGTSRDRKSRADWLASQTCLACTQAAAVEAAAAAGLPALTGSDRQVAWATTIRAEVLSKIAGKREEFAALGRRKGASEEQVAEELAKFDAAVAGLVSKTSAAWWIDNRHMPAMSFLRYAQVQP